jgi:four helix bundle protein
VVSLEGKPIQSFRGLKVYEASYRLSLQIHRLTEAFPDMERYELSKQMRRAAFSIPLNIAEGYGRRDSALEFKRFLRMALGSGNELQVCLDMAKDLGCVTEAVHGDLLSDCEVLCRRLASLIKRWKKLDYE